MLWLALSTLRARRGGFVGAFVTLLCAAALVTACGVLLETGLHGNIATDRYAATPIVVAGDPQLHVTVHKKKDKTKTKSKELAERPMLPASTVDQVRQVPGVDRVVSEVIFPASVVHDGRPVSGPDDGPSWGHSWDSAALTPFTLRDGRAPEKSGEVVVDAALAERAGLHPGASVRVISTDGLSEHRVVGVAAPAGRDGLDHEASVFFSAAEAGELSGRDGAVATVGVFPEKGTDVGAVRAALGTALKGTTAKIFTGDDRGKAEFRDASKARLMLVSVGGALGGTSLLVAILVVAGTFALSTHQREREIALLRTVGATPRQIRKMIGGEALAVAAVAGVLGAAAGMGVAVWLRGRFVDLDAIPDMVRLTWSPFPLLAAVVATLGAGWAAARLSARRAARIRPIEALAEASAAPARMGVGRVLAGLVCTGGAVTLTLVLRGLSTEPAASPVTFLTVVLWAAAISLLGPVLARAALLVVRLPLRLLTGAGGYLALANARANTRRVASIVTPLSLLIAMACTVLFVPSTMEHAAQREAEGGNRSDYTLLAADPGIPGSLAAAARALPGAAAVTEVLHTTVRVGLDKYPAQGVTTEGIAETMDLDVRSGSIEDLTTGTVAVSQTAAKQRHVGIGDTMDVRLGDGVIEKLRVVAVYDRGMGYGDITLPGELVASHVDNPLSNTVLVAAGSNESTGATGSGQGCGDAAGSGGGCDLRTALTALTHDYPGVRVIDRSEAAAVEAAGSTSSTQVNYVAMGLIVAFCVIAAVNTSVMSTLARTGELAMVRLVGTTRRQVRRMMRTEAAVTAVLAVVLGSVVSFVTLSAFSTGMTGSGVPHVPLVDYLLVVGGTAFLALVATMVPLSFALRTAPATLVGTRE